MPIIIDTNCIANVFEQNSARHSEFSDVLKWIRSGKGIMVYGGTKYINELKKTPKYLKIIKLLKESNKVFEGDMDKIDKYQCFVESLSDDSDFDDPHLVAISVVTNCLLICSEDRRSIKHVKDKKYYPKNSKVPSYYTSSNNSNLLSDMYIHKDFKSLKKPNKATQDKLNLIKP